MKANVADRSVSTSRVLFATDFSDCAVAALPFAIALARQPGGRLSVAHIVSIGALASGLPSHASLALTAQGIRAAHASMERMQAQLSGTEHQTIVRSGDIASEIAALVESEHIDVMVLGTHGRAGFGKVVFGSVAEKLFRHALCPVLTIGPGVRSGPEHVEEVHSILYPTDFSKESLRALAYATSLAQEHRARLYLLHVTPDEPGSDRASIESRLREMLPEGQPFSCEPRGIVRSGPAADAILDAASELAVDLIVIGPKRRSVLPGSMAVTYKVVTQAPCPVLTVRG